MPQPLRSRILRATALAVALAFAFACAPQQPQPDHPSGGETGASAPSSAGGAPAAQGTPKRDGTLVIALPAETGSLDPQATTSLNAQRVREQMFDSLLAADWDLKTLLPSLAESWQVSPDGLTYTFKLRQDVKFHSGKPLTSEDVRYTFDRWRNGASPTRWLIAGVTGIETPDPYTVVLTVSEPNPDLLYNLARSEASILNQASVEAAGADFGTRVIDGTGPFKLKEWSVKNQIVLERFDDYHWAPPSYQNRGPAYLKEIVWKSLPEETTRLLELETGGVQIVPPRISFHEIDRLKGLRDVEVMDYPLGSTVIIGFNTRLAPADDPEVRHAVLMGIDVQRIIDQVLYGHADYGVSLVAPGVDGFCAPCKDVIPSYDPARARQILDDDGWRPGPDGIRVKDGQRLSLLATPYTTVPYPEAYTVIQAQLREIGVNLDLQPAETSKIFELYQRGAHGIWSTSIPHDRPYQAVFNFLHSSSIPSPNRFPYRNAEVDRLIDEARTSMDPAKANEDWAKAQYIALQSYVFRPFFHERGEVAVHRKVHGFRPYGYVNSVFQKMTDTWVE